jgi:hypothetical protein
MLVATSAELKVCYRRQPGRNMLVLSFTRFDPKQTKASRAFTLKKRSDPQMLG